MPPNSVEVSSEDKYKNLSKVPHDTAHICIRSQDVKDVKKLTSFNGLQLIEFDKCGVDLGVFEQHLFNALATFIYDGRDD